MFGTGVSVCVSVSRSRSPGFRLSTSVCFMCDVISHDHSTARILSCNQSKIDCFGVSVCAPVFRFRLRASPCRMCTVFSHEQSTARTLSWNQSKIGCFGVSVCTSVSRIQAICFHCVLFVLIFVSREHSTANIVLPGCCPGARLRSSVSVSLYVPRCPDFRLSASCCLIFIVVSHEKSTAHILSWNESKIKIIRFGVSVCVSVSRIQATCFSCLMCNLFSQEHRTA